MFRFAFILPVGGLVLAVAAAAQPPRAARPQPAPTFRTGVSLVRVDVTVTDRHGVPVDDLTAADFTIEEDGAVRPIEAFQFVRLTGQPAPGDDLSLEIRSLEHGRAEAGREDVRVFALFLDDYHVTRSPPVTLRLREALTAFVESLGPTDLVAVMDPLTPLSALQFTRSRTDMLERIRTFEGRRGIYVPARSLLEEGQLAARNVARMRAEVTLSALHALATHLGAIRERRSTVVFVSEGPPLYFRDGDLEHRMRDILQAANRGNVTINVLDPRGLQPSGLMSVSDTLMRLAGQTGGRAAVATNDLGRALGQVVLDSSGYYLLGYVPAGDGLDGRFHRIEVRVGRRGVRVLARRGYWAPSAAEVTASQAAAEPVPLEVARAMGSLAEPRSGHPARTWIGFDPASEGRTRMTLSWEPDAPAAPGAPAPRLLRVAGRDPEGRAAIDATLPLEPAPVVGLAAAGAGAFDLLPGRLTLQFSLLAGDETVLDGWTEEIVVPDLARRRVVLTTPRLHVARTALAFRRIDGGAPAAPAAVREFRRGERVIVRWTVEAGPDARPDVAATLLNGRGAVLRPLPFKSPVHGGYELELPVASLAAGDYIVRIEAKLDEAATTELVAFRIVS
jgi:VWFA-related protein